MQQPHSNGSYPQNHGPREIQEVLREWVEKRLEPRILAARAEQLEQLIEKLVEQIPLEWGLLDAAILSGHEAAQKPALETTGGSTVAAKAATDHWEFWCKTRDGMHIVFEHRVPSGEWCRLEGATILNPPAWLHGHFHRESPRPLDIRASEIVLWADGGH